MFCKYITGIFIVNIYIVWELFSSNVSYAFVTVFFLYEKRSLLFGCLFNGFSRSKATKIKKYSGSTC